MNRLDPAGRGGHVSASLLSADGTARRDATIHVLRTRKPGRHAVIEITIFGAESAAARLTLAQARAMFAALGRAIDGVPARLETERVP